MSLFFFLPGRNEMFLAEKNSTRLRKIQVVFSLCALEMSLLSCSPKPFAGRTHAVALTVGEIPMLLK